MNTKSPVIAVFGLSGVGKSRLIAKVVHLRPNRIISVHAGSLIRNGTATRQKSAEDLRLAPMEEILANQNVLAEQLASYRTANPEKCILLDGHCVVDNGKELVTIPASVIKNLDLQSIVYVKEPAQTILERRVDDVSRIRPPLSIAKINEHQNLAISACERYKQELGIELQVVSSSDDTKVLKLCEDI